MRRFGLLDAVALVAGGLIGLVVASLGIEGGNIQPSVAAIVSISPEVWGTIVGAIIAGVIGIVTLFVAQVIQRHKELNEAILGPAFDFLRSIPAQWPWRQTIDPPWEHIPAHQWLGVPRKYRIPLNDFARTAMKYNSELGAYFEFMASGGWNAYQNDLRSALHKYVVSGGYLNSIPLGVGTGVIDVQPVVEGLAPAILLTPTDPEQVRKTLGESTSDTIYLARKVTEALSAKDPHSLRALCQAIAEDSLSARAGKLVRDVDSAFKQVVEKGASCKVLLESRLGVKDVSP